MKKLRVARASANGSRRDSIRCRFALAFTIVHEHAMLSETPGRFLAIIYYVKISGVVYNKIAVKE
jgi:hypothetical protein